MASRVEERQQKAYEEIRAEVERGLEETGLGVRVHEGFLRRLADNNEER